MRSIFDKKRVKENRKVVNKIPTLVLSCSSVNLVVAATVLLVDVAFREVAE